MTIFLLYVYHVDNAYDQQHYWLLHVPTEWTVQVCVGIAQNEQHNLNVRGHIVFWTILFTTKQWRELTSEYHIKQTLTSGIHNSKT